MAETKGSKRLIIKLLPSLILIAALGTVLWIAVPFVIAKLKGREAPLAPTEAPPVNVEVLRVKPEPTIADTVDLPAVIEPNRIVAVAAEVPGQVEKITFQEGESCQAGDKIIFLDDDLLKADFDRAEAQAKLDAGEYERIRFLSDRGGATAKELDSATAAMALSRASLESARIRLDRSTIAAPVAGVLEEIPVEKGEYVQAGTTVAEIVDVDTMKVAVQMPEKDVPYLKLADHAKILADVKGNELELEGAISYISELADAQTHTTRTEITVDNRRRLLRSGQIVRVRLTRRILENVIMIPLLAVIPLEEGKAVFVAEEGKAQRREVELRMIKGQSIQVTKGLQDGDLLIVSGQRFVGIGQKVNIVAEH